MCKYIANLILCLCFCLQVMGASGNTKINVYTDPSINIQLPSSLSGSTPVTQPVVAWIDYNTCLVACSLSNGAILVAQQTIGKPVTWVDEVFISGYHPLQLVMSVDGKQVVMACETTEGNIATAKFAFDDKGIINQINLEIFDAGSNPQVYINSNKESFLVLKNAATQSLHAHVSSFNGRWEKEKRFSNSTCYTSSTIGISSKFVNDDQGVIAFLGTDKTVKSIRLRFSEKDGIIAQDTLLTGYTSSSTPQCVIDDDFYRSFIQFINSNQQLQGFCVADGNTVDSGLILLSDISATVLNAQLTGYFGFVTSIWQSTTPSGVYGRFIDYDKGNPILSPISTFSVGGSHPNVVSLGYDVLASCYNGTSLVIGITTGYDTNVAPVWITTSVAVPSGSSNTNPPAMSFLGRGEIVCNISSLQELFVVAAFPYSPQKHLQDTNTIYSPFRRVLGNNK